VILLNHPLEGAQCSTRWCGVSFDDGILY